MREQIPAKGKREIIHIVTEEFNVSYMLISHLGNSNSENETETKCLLEKMIVLLKPH